MAMQNFIDHVRLYAQSGDGGAGSAHLRREKYKPNGGPDGGDGGRGGHIILRGNRNLWTLLHLRYQKHVKAKSGANGMQNQKYGADGEDVILEVPLGTVATDEDTGETLVEILDHKEEVILLPGGKGGLGNVHFKSSTRQTPRYAQPGLPGQEKTIVLELKVLADVGLVGFPNAGKSTLLAHVSAAKPKIASYAFTTLTPNLGIVSYRDNRSFVMADIPGIIEDAHLGKGIGHRFLRHIERNAVLLFMIPAESEDIPGEYDVLKRELRLYNPELLDKPRVLALTKSDLIDEELQSMLDEELDLAIPHMYISAVTGSGISELKDRLWQAITAGNSDPT